MCVSVAVLHSYSILVARRAVSRRAHVKRSPSITFFKRKGSGHEDEWQGMACCLRCWSGLIAIPSHWPSNLVWCSHNSQSEEAVKNLSFLESIPSSPSSWPVNDEFPNMEHYFVCSRVKEYCLFTGILSFYGSFVLLCGGSVFLQAFCLSMQSSAFLHLHTNSRNLSAEIQLPEEHWTEFPKRLDDLGGIWASRITVILPQD